MIDKEVIEKKFQELSIYLKELEKNRDIPWKDFSSSLGKQWLICHGLQLSIQIIFDVGNHILASIGENQIEDYVDIIDKLGEREIIPSEFAKTIRGMAGLRNILVHEYVDLDLKKYTRFYKTGWATFMILWGMSIDLLVKDKLNEEGKEGRRRQTF